jgi:hypothetical protein
MWPLLKLLLGRLRSFFRLEKQSEALALQSSQFNLEEARKKMSKSSKLRTDFKLAIDHIRDRVVSNVVEGNQKNLYKVSDNDIRAIVRIVEASFEQGFISASSQIEQSINEATK